MINVVTIGWLTTDDIILANGTCSMAVQGGGALYSAVGAHIWSEGVGIHSVAGKPYFAQTCRLIEERGIDASGIGQCQGNGLELWLLHESDIHKQQVPKLSSSDALGLDEQRGPLPESYARASAFHIAPQGPASSISNAKKLGSLKTKPILAMDILSDNFIESSMYLELDFLSHLTAFLPSQAEIERIWQPSSLESWLQENAIRYKCHMVAKLGARGSLVCEARTGTLTHVPALPANVRDTTGAGDGYCGGFVAGLAAGKSPVGCAAMATVSSSYIVEASGALATKQPTADEKLTRLQIVEAAIRPLSSGGSRS
ncbi:ribokinase [Phyllobacterium trifolii]|uniref:Ribokinase n=1 Tax=Phyllobacterium trifolii TaxID=300193 RepID=A0A839UHK3_9HYPH|nr:PfkB family carbohydrate kinase [Phyllobacterium trifolii]MBB3148350.1 ribokinase [Phyllobacterium trifolii]